MKAKHFWARHYSRNVDATCVVDVIEAHVEGFNLALEHAAKMVEELVPGHCLEFVIRAIGSAQVDPKTGERLDK